MNCFQKYYKLSFILFFFLSILHYNNWAQSNSSEQWKKTGLTNPIVNAIAFDSKGHIFAGTSKCGVFKSTDNGIYWTHTNLNNITVEALAINSLDHIFAGTRCGGLFRSSDNGETWKHIGDDIPNDTINVLCISSAGHIFAGTKGEGIYRSIDNGENWKLINNGLNNNRFFSFVINSKGNIFASSGRTYCSTNNGNSWEKSDLGIKSTIYSLAINSSDHLFAGTNKDGIYRSTDYGKSWEQVLNEDKDNYFPSMLVNKIGDIYAGTYGKGILRSVDNGKSWSKLINDFKSDYILSMNIHPNGEIFAGTFYNGLITTSKVEAPSSVPKQYSNNGKENLGKNINSEFAELAPVISPDGKTIYFTRDSHPNNIRFNKDKKGSFQDIWFSKLQTDGQWSTAINIGPPLNNNFNNALNAVTPDGNTVLLINKYFSDGSVSSGLSLSHRTSTGWSLPKNLYIKNYYNSSTSSSNFLANDGKTLLLSISRNDSYGSKDIYISFLNERDEWSEPMNLGPTINTDLDEMTPFLASDGVSLYFSSDGHGGYGGADVFVSRRLDNSWRNWSSPENLGPIINSNAWDAYYTIPASGDYAYFVSQDNSFGKSDIFRVLLPKEMRPNPVVLLFGKAINAKTKEPIEAKIIYETLPDGKEVGTARSDPINGGYKITLPSGVKYGFRAEAKGFISVNDNIEILTLSEYKEIERNLELVPIELGQKVRLNNIFFDFDKAILRDESFPELNRIVSMLNENPYLRIEVAGHTDYKGTIEYNQKLSESRAKSITEYLLQKNIDKKRIVFKGYGKSKPVANNDTEEGRQLNRRVEFIIIK